MNKIKEGEIHQGVIDFTKNGNASLKIGLENIFIHRKMTKNSLDGDLVEIEIFKGERKLEAKVISVITRNKKEFVGKVQKGEKSTFVVVDNPKITTDFYIKGGLVAEDGQKVVVELTKWDGSKSPQAKIIKILGDSGDNNTEMNSIMFEYGLPVDFPQEVLNESELIPEVITEKEISKRKDMRSITTIGIDPFDSKDADDTISLEQEGDFSIVSVNIADVTHYIKEGSELDKEAYRRGSSVYLVDRCVPMFPNRLSNGICSLKSGSDKLAFTARFKIDKRGKIKERWFGRTVINVDRDYSYEQAQEIIETGVANTDCDRVVLELDRIAKVLRKNRMSDNFLEISSLEVKFKLAEDNKKPIGVYFKEQVDSNKLIEEFMLLANREVAKFIKGKGLPCVNRVHEKPDDDKLVNIKRVAENFGYKIDISDPLTTKSELNRLLKEVKGSPEENMLSTLVIRSQKKAIYSTDSLSGHYGLSFDDYCHFTSPIRRYSDVLVHRLLSTLVDRK